MRCIIMRVHFDNNVTVISGWIVGEPKGTELLYIFLHIIA